MTIKYIAIGFAACATLGSCIKHEVIPAPKPEVELDCEFSALINGTSINLVENVNGFTCSATKAKEILPAPQPSSAIYFSQMQSSTSLEFFKIGMGELQWDAGASSDPSLSQFESFFNANTNPNYSFQSANGVEVTFRDQTGTVWMSNENSVNPQNFDFTSFTQESDESGDYMKFTTDFECYLYNATMDDSILVEAGNYKSHFKL